jgi:hypothetical protein
MYLSIGQLDYLGFFAFISNYRGGHFHEENLVGLESG